MCKPINDKDEMILTKDQSKAMDKTIIERGGEAVTWLRENHPGMMREYDRAIADLALTMALTVQAKLEGDSETLESMKPLLAARAAELIQLADAEVKS